MKRSLIALGTAAFVGGCYTSALKPITAAPSQIAAGAERATPSASPTSSDTEVLPAADSPKPAEVQRTAAAVFGDTLIEVPVIDVPMPAEGPTWDMDVRSYETQERVAFYVNMFTQTSRTRFQEKLKLGTRYDPMIRAKLRASGIPEDMTFLALVESGYDPNAYSSAAAVGMWQFMSSTARDVGLRVDWWVDERRDPARSTDGAIRFLRDLQNQFGSLYLAAAAYNGGPGRVSRGLTRFAEEMQGSAGEDRFFALAEQNYLRSETKNYVPQIIAAALVGKEPARYGIQFDTLAHYQYDSIEVAAGTPLSAVATAAGIGIGAIKELNPAVLRGMTPPSGPLWVRVPFSSGTNNEQIHSALNALPEWERVGFAAVKTKGSETSSSIAGKAGISTKQLAWYNPGLRTSKKGKILAGQTLRIPTLATVAAATTVPDPSIERYGSSTVAATRSGSVHIVKRGESLGRIASRYNLSVARLKSLNGMRGDRVVAGQALRVLATTVSRTTTTKKPAASSASSAKSRRAASASVARKPVVKKPVASKAGSKTSVKKPTTGKTSASARATPVKAAAKAPAKKVAASKAATTKKGTGK
ncbi:MAG: transglycosylase SLT domain-containing protein [Phycisphaerae bacterium]|nr:transglycosylase SLT domain-containing protein [Gemmatimonadaceae bacterium]